MTKVIVVTCPELGWDCVVDIYEYSEENLEAVNVEYPYPQYIVTDADVRTEVERN